MTNNNSNSTKNTQTLTFYNNKGGVSKTTTLFNVGAYLSKLGKKVLFIDADSQCNLTELFFANDEEYFDNPNKQLPGDSILDVFRPRLDGAAARIDVRNISLAESNIYSNLYLIRGDIEFSAQAEPYFGTSINQAITTNINEKNTYISFRRLIEDLGKEFALDYILIDLGPSTGAITRLAFLASDKFIIPVTPDRFCYLGINTLPKLIEDWIKHDKIILDTLEPYGIESNYGSPEFCGLINQNFQVHKSLIKESYQKWSKNIKKEIKSKLMASKIINIKPGLSDPIICSIENLGQLVPVSQMLGKAIFDLTQSDSALASKSGVQFYGSVWEPWDKKINAYRNEIQKITKAIE
ncbi:ParA family protein [Pseudomonas sp. 13B_3.2_Bac1]|uniref:ParA family protein n=1 Tax=Pseudomonas sp. 13B_3.2_Bac1 TaxID=2971623 RepID=UPI0021C6FAA6|nr:ParA family protein [Pseudomonas sp. 13B_3.2_Bac1]MCU1772057.1 ParA family protein [Pseudomonas sp. 13B_3.2_Bac1]